MNIKEVFKKCNDGDCVIDNFNKKWKVDGEELREMYFGNWCNLINFYTLKQILYLDFKKVYDIDWSKLEVDTKILVSFDNEKWYKRYFAKFEDGKIYTFANGTTSFSYNYRELVPWQYAKLYKEEK